MIHSLQMPPGSKHVIVWRDHVLERVFLTPGPPPAEPEGGLFEPEEAAVDGGEAAAAGARLSSARL
jgi:hypothetical protein